jgi:hypothetical protein
MQTQPARRAGLSIALSELLIPVFVFAGTFGARATTYTISLVGSNTQEGNCTSSCTVPVGWSVGLKATTNVSPSPYYIEVYDVTTGQEVGRCSTVTSCYPTVESAVPGTHVYRAYVSNATATYPPTGIQATSNTVTITWGAWTVSLNANPKFVKLGKSTTLTATTNFDVYLMLEDIFIFDTTNKKLIARCTSGKTCQGTESILVPGAHTFRAFVAYFNNSNDYPPQNQVATSAPVVVTWGVCVMSVCI